MAEETVTVETQEVPLDQSSMPEYKKARAEGKESVVREVFTTKQEAEEHEPEQSESSDEKPKGKGGFQKRIDRLIKQTAALEDQLAAERKEKEELRSKANGKTEEKTIDPNAEPVRTSFDSEAAYIRALTRWEVKQELKAEREAEEKEAVVAQQKEAISNYNKKAIEAQARYDDWKEVMAQDTELPSIVGDAIVNTIKNGPDVAYYLGKHPEVCEEMMSVHPLEAVAMAVKISEQLSGDEKEETEDTEVQEEEKKAEEVEKPKSKAPAPIRPVSGGTTRSTIPLDKADFKTYKKLRAQGRVQ